MARPELTRVLREIRDERTRQDAKWGQQNHPDGTGPDVRQGPPVIDMRGVVAANVARMVCKHAGATPEGDTWAKVLLEEVFEALAEDDPARLRTELIQSAAVIAAWVEAIDRRGATKLGA